MFDQMSDPDYYYHVALSKQIVANGFPETVPQVKDIGWNILFTDKEYLYHVITSLFYSLFGEAGIRASSVVLLSITSLTLAFQSLKNLGLRLFLLPLVIVACDPHFLRRMLMVRPQTLAVLLFVFILIGFISQRKYMVLIFSMLFALSYHGLQIPGLLIAASLVTTLVAQPRYIRLAGFCVAGLVMGCLLNPYFPGNIEMLTQITHILHDTAIKGSEVSYGRELYAWNTREFLDYSWLSFAVLILAFVSLGHLHGGTRESEKEDFSLLFFLTISLCLFFIVSMYTPRGREYLVPCAVLLAIQVLRQTPITGTVLIALTMIAQFTAIQFRYPMLYANEKDMASKKQLIAALELLPKDEKAHVLNCNWSQSPFLMYARPNMTFVDILDPSYLMRANPSLHEAREDWVRGKVSDLRYVVGDVFKAEYVYCDEPPVSTELDADPHFVRIYPSVPVTKAPSTMGIFKLVQKQPLANFERAFVYSLPKNRDEWTPINADMPGPKEPFASNYLNLLAKLSRDTLIEKTEKADERIGNCIFVKPNSLATHVGADHIALGGGPNLRLRINDEPIYENNGEPERLRSIDILIPLAAPLKASDKVEVMVCPGVVQKYLGLSLSFWTSSQMQQICATRGLTIQTEDEAIQWAYKGVQDKNCLGPIASRARYAAPQAPEKPKKKL